MNFRRKAGIALALSAMFGLPPAASATVTGGGSVPAAGAHSCPAPSDSRVASAADLEADNQQMADFGARPTASPAHQQFVEWLDGRLRAIPGFTVTSTTYHVDRWLESGVELAAGPDAASLVTLPPSGAVPYARTTPGLTAPLVYIPAGTAMAGHDVTGKIVVRDAVPGQVPFIDFTAVEWAHYDPDLSLTTAAAKGAVYERDFAGYQQRLDDLAAAARQNAAGLVFVHGFPREQVQGQYAPYEGTRWGVPALYVGADEGARLKALAASGGVAHLRVSAFDEMADTKMLTATLPGASAQRIIVQSHTDGINPVWDNGPIAMLALARHFATLPRACRPRTLQFVFTTGHIYQHLLGTQDRGGSAELEAKQVDRAYGRGDVALVFAIEHLGAKEYAAKPRTDGGPGRVLKPTGQTEVNTMFAGESPVLAAEVLKAVADRKLARTYILRGADVPAAHIPVHQSFGGEGTAYQQHLIPSIALVTGPWTLYNPHFGMEAIDFPLMRQQTLVFADMIRAVGSIPAPLLGGGYLAERAGRTALCASALAKLGFVRCPGDAYG